MKSFSNKNQTGFTLVEMAIVLVIIGLILGGVLKGQELVVQARVKSMINDFNQVTAAYYTYFDRYKRFPGDDNTVVTGRSWATTAGNSNGIIEGDFNSTTATDESRLIWQHLRIAGIVSGATTDTSQPVNAVGGVTGIQNTAFTGTARITDTVICTSAVPPRIAEIIDYAIDDGLSVSGLVQSGAAANGAASSTYNDAITAGTNLVVCRRL